jgi:hypothetical protein
VKRTVFGILALLFVLFGLFCALNLLYDLEPVARALATHAGTPGAILIFAFLTVHSLFLSSWFYRHSGRSEESN